MTEVTLQIFRKCSIVVALLCVSLSLWSQEDKIVVSKLQLIAQGKIDQVKKDLPDLMAQYSDSPGIIFLHAVCLDDASKAIALYSKIVKEFPTSQWADDSQHRLVQYFSLKRDTAKARAILVAFREKYPESPFLLTAHSIVQNTVGLPLQQAKKPSAVKTPTPGPTIATTTNPPTTSTPSASAIEIPTSQVDVVEPAPAKKYTLQVGVYQTKESAERDASSYRAKRLRCTVIEKLVAGEKRWAVVVGEYSRQEDAQKAHDLVKKECNCDPFILPRE